MQNQKERSASDRRSSYVTASDEVFKAYEAEQMRFVKGSISGGAVTAGLQRALATAYGACKRS